MPCLSHLLIECDCVLQAVDDQVKLLSIQRQLEQQFRSQFVGLPIYDTIFEVCLALTKKLSFETVPYNS